MEFTIDYIKENLDFWVNENLLSPSELEFSNIIKANLQDENADSFYEIFKFWDAREDRLSLRKLALNYNVYHKGLRFGFTTFWFDEYGWLKNENWDGIEVIEFGVKGFHATNKIILGKGKNDMWSYGLYYGISFAGGAFGLSIYSKSFDSYESVYEFALNDILNKLTEIAIQPNSAQRNIIKQIKYELATLKKVDENNQLSFF